MVFLSALNKASGLETDFTAFGKWYFKVYLEEAKIILVIPVESAAILAIAFLSTIALRLKFFPS